MQISACACVRVRMGVAADTYLLFMKAAAGACSSVREIPSGASVVTQLVWGSIRGSELNRNHLHTEHHIPSVSHSCQTQSKSTEQLHSSSADGEEPPNISWINACTHRSGNVGHSTWGCMHFMELSQFELPTSRMFYVLEEQDDVDGMTPNKTTCISM